jgi:hypothetical protein
MVYAVLCTHNADGIIAICISATVSVKVSQRWTVRECSAMYRFVGSWKKKILARR